MSKAIKVLVVTSIHPDYDKRVWRHARGLAAAGMEVTLFCPWSIQDGQEVEGVTIRSFAKARSRAQRILLPFRMTARLTKLSMAHDIVHFHDLDLLPFMALMACFSDKFVYDMHENYPDEMLVRDWIPKPLRKFTSVIVRYGQALCCRMVRNVVHVTPSQVPDIPESARKLEVRNYASSGTFPDKVMEHRRGVLFTGSNYYLNGTMLLLDIARELKGLGNDIPIRLVDMFSDLDFRETFLLQRKQLGLENCIEILRPVPSDKMPTLLREGSIAIIPSLDTPKQQKAIPTRIFEFMAVRMPIIASDMQHVRSAVHSAKAGILVAPGDAKAFAQAIDRVDKDPALAKELGDCGRKAFDLKFNWEAQMPVLVKFYEEVLQMRKVEG